jgi:hypothetical protein
VKIDVMDHQYTFTVLATAYIYNIPAFKPQGVNIINTTIVTEPIDPDAIPDRVR